MGNRYCKKSSTIYSCKISATLLCCAVVLFKLSVCTAILCAVSRDWQTCCRRLFFGPGHCMPQLWQGSIFRASLAEHNPQGSASIAFTRSILPFRPRGAGMGSKSGRDPVRSPGATHVLFPKTPRLRLPRARPLRTWHVAAMRYFVADSLPSARLSRVDVTPHTARLDHHHRTSPGARARQLALLYVVLDCWCVRALSLSASLHREGKERDRATRNKGAKLVCGACTVNTMCTVRFSHTQKGKKAREPEAKLVWCTHSKYGVPYIVTAACRSCNRTEEDTLPRIGYIGGR